MKTGDCTPNCNTSETSGGSISLRESDHEEQPSSKRYRLSGSPNLLSEHSYSRQQSSSSKSSETFDGEGSSDAISPNKGDDNNTEQNDEEDKINKSACSISPPPILSKQEPVVEPFIDNKDKSDCEEKSPVQTSDTENFAKTHKETQNIKKVIPTELERLIESQKDFKTKGLSKRRSCAPKRFENESLDFQGRKSSPRRSLPNGISASDRPKEQTSTTNIPINKRKRTSYNSDSDDDGFKGWTRSEATSSTNSSLYHIPAPPPPIGLELWIYKNIFSIAFAKSPRGFVFKCLIEGCRFQTLVRDSMYEHLKKKHEKQSWNGFCNICMDVVARENKGIFDEFAHLEKHITSLSIEISEMSLQSTSSTTHSTSSSSKILQTTMTEQMKKRLTETLTNLADAAITNGKPVKKKKQSIKASVNVAPSKPSKQPTSSAAISKVELPSVSASKEESSNIYENSTTLRPWLKTGNDSMKSKGLIATMRTKTCLSATYKCMSATCNFFSSDHGVFKTHLEFHQKFTPTDSLNFLSCPYCNFVGTSVNVFISHIEKEHAHDRYQCSYCFYRSCSDFSVQTHQSLCHKSKAILIIELGESSARDQSAIDKAKKCRKENVPPLVCVFCRGMFFVMESFISHLKDHKENVPIQCIKCGEKTTKDSLHSHLSCINLGLFHCIYCDFGTDEFDFLNNHIAHEHPSNMPYFCERTASRQKDGKLKIVRKLIFYCFQALQLISLNIQFQQSPSVVEATCLKSIKQRVDNELICKPPNKLVFLRNEKNVGQLRSDLSVTKETKGKVANVEQIIKVQALLPPKPRKVIAQMPMETLQTTETINSLLKLL